MAVLDWFEKEAPIRVKFRALFAVHAVLACVGVITTVLAGGGAVLVGAAGAALAATLLTVAIASKRICTPYVNTVVRMEALAAGDTTSPIAYTDYNDCVGRMTKAMSTFRDNAKEVQENREAQDIIVTELSSALKKLAENDLDFAITREFPGQYDELRRDFNDAIEALSETIGAVRNASARVLNGASEIRAASDDLAVRNEQQAASLEETAAAMNQATESVKQTAGSSTEAQQSIASAHREATEGGEVVRRANEAMAAIEKSAQEITQIIDVIEGIAFQTNLLALNAGVEAARAGDAGKGFAVVANEVRALAQRSAEAAKDIKELINSSTEQVDGGVALVNETGGLLQKIVDRVGSINELVSGIAESANAQASNLQQVNGAVGEMDRMTQQNAAMVEESTAAARSLADEADELTSMVERFRTSGDKVSFERSAGQGRGRAQPANDRNGGKAAKPVAARSRTGAGGSGAATAGNLALAQPAADEDWAEF